MRSLRKLVKGLNNPRRRTVEVIGAVVLATIVLLVLVILGARDGVAIALAALPLCLAPVALVWPSKRLSEEPPEVDVKFPPRPWKALDAKVEPTLDQLFKVAREQADVEEDKAKTYSERAGILLGFAGVILALVGAEAKDLFEEAASLGTVGRPLGAWLLVAGALMTSIAAICALAVVLRRPSERVTTQQLADFLSFEMYERRRVAFVYSQLEILICKVKTDREENQRLREWFNTGLVSLVIALFFLLLHLGVYLERTVETSCEREARSSATPSGLLQSYVSKLGDHEEGPPPCLKTEKTTDYPPS